MTAAGVDPIKPAAARGASPLGFLVAGPAPTTVAEAEAPALRDLSQTAHDRFRLVFSLSGAIPQDIRPPSVIGRLLHTGSRASRRFAAGRMGKRQRRCPIGRLPPRPATRRRSCGLGRCRLKIRRRRRWCRSLASWCIPARQTRYRRSCSSPRRGALRPTSSSRVSRRSATTSTRCGSRAGPVPRLILEALPRDPRRHDARQCEEASLRSGGPPRSSFRSTRRLPPPAGGWSDWRTGSRGPTRSLPPTRSRPPTGNGSSQWPISTERTPSTCGSF